MKVHKDSARGKASRKRKAIAGARIPLMVAGWREWVALPELGVPAIKAKLDTGARTSAIHAWNIEPFSRRGVKWVRFILHPRQRDNTLVVHCEARVVDQRKIRSSSGIDEPRYLIETLLRVCGHEWPIELSLTNRDEMGFRLLVGRSAMRSRIMVDPQHSMKFGRPPKVNRQR